MPHPLTPPNAAPRLRGSPWFSASCLGLPNWDLGIHHYSQFRNYCFPKDKKKEERDGEGEGRGGVRVGKETGRGRGRGRQTCSHEESWWFDIT